jgi:hypothetical protein
MTRRFSVFAIAIFAGSILAPTAWGQTANQSKSLAERMSALRRGLSPESRETRETPPTTSSRDAAPSAAPATESQPRSLIPNWFGKNEDQAPAAAPSPPRAGSNAAARPAATPRAAATRSNSRTANDAALPGLGGSPLPQGKWTPSRQNAAARGNAYRDASADYPVIRDVTREKTATAQPSADTAQSAANRPATRRSPERRPAPHINPDDLRRELTGAFSPNQTGPTARTARADDRYRHEEPAAEAPLVLAPTDTSTPPSAASASDATQEAPQIEQLQPVPQAQVQAPPATADTASESARSAAEAFGAAVPLRPSFGSDNFTRSPRSDSLSPELGVERRREVFGEALQVANGGDPSVLVSNQTPIIAADIRGPKQILVGRDAVYRVRLQNQGAAPAEGVVATVRVPSWAEVMDTVATQGTVRPSQNAATPTQLEWQLARIDGRATETLDIRLVPRESRPLELGISWTIAPVGSRAIVEVQEPQLKIEVTGPNEVLFAKPQVFKLTVSNPGTGPAEEVKIDLVPPGGNKQTATSHTIGTLGPGESKSVDIELTAREAGKLQIQAIATAAGGLSLEMDKDIFCRKPELELDWRGATTHYAGTTATYYFRIRNPGTAPAEDVAIKVALPEGAEFGGASEGQVFDAQRRQVSWQVGTLAPGDDNYMELKCMLKKPGINQLLVTAADASGELTDNATAETNVIALADLKLEVSDPSGAVAVGTPALYEIRVANRGASAAKNVTIVALFSDGIEPDQAEGAMYTVADGRVAFRPIEELPAGGAVTIRIRAHALQPGTHVFRAEVLCSDAEIKLAAEETTRFYADEVSSEAEAADQQAATRSGFEASVR